MKENRYQRFSADADFSNLDHIIIGSGMGGLTAANWLAKAGKKVLILEQHYVPGGFLHTFKRKKGFSWDVGVHYLGNLHEKSQLRKMFNFLTQRKLDFEYMGDVYDIVHIGSDRYEIKAGVENFRSQMHEYFPEEKLAIDQYLKLIKKANKWGGIFYFEKTFKPILQHTVGRYIRKKYEKYSQKSTLEVLQQLTDNQRLIAVLCAQCGNYGLSPKNSSFGVHAMVIEHFMEGGYYPKGGADQIALTAIEHLNKNGSQVLIKAKVEEIVVQKNRVQGVKVDGLFIPCKSVISNTGIEVTFKHLLSNEVAQKCGFEFKNIQPSTGHICLYVGLDESAATLKLPKNNVWYFEHDDYDDILDNITLKTAVQKFSYISFPSAKDPEWEEKHPNTATIQAITAAHYDWFKEFEEKPWMKRGEKYEALKEEFQNNMLERLYELFPQIKGHVIETEVSTPLSTKYFSNYQHGEIYGLAHTPERFKLSYLRPETKTKGLYLVGQDITLVGVAGAMLSGMLAAITILKFRVWKVFKDINATPTD